MARRSFFSYKPLLVKKPSVVKYLCVWRHLTRTGLGDWCSANHQDRPGAAQQEVLAAADGMFVRPLTFQFLNWQKAVFPWLTCCCAGLYFLCWFPWMNCPIPRHSNDELTRAWYNWWRKIHQTEDTQCKCNRMWTECFSLQHLKQAQTAAGHELIYKLWWQRLTGHRA